VHYIETKDGEARSHSQSAGTTTPAALRLHWTAHYLHLSRDRALLHAMHELH
jgi:hypothetical protein